MITMFFSLKIFTGGFCWDMNSFTINLELQMWQNILQFNEKPNKGVWKKGRTQLHCALFHKLDCTEFSRDHQRDARHQADFGRRQKQCHLLVGKSGICKYQDGRRVPPCAKAFLLRQDGTVRPDKWRILDTNMTK